MVILGIGSNLSSSQGDRLYNVDQALSLILNNEVKLIKKSSYYETPSYPNEKDPKFINVVVSIKTDLKPDKLASLLFNIEKKLERKRDKKNDPRTCDVDVIDYNGEIINFDFDKFIFSVPHERLQERNFVLYPLQEILPNWEHPITKETIGYLIEKLNSKKKMSILKVKKP